MLFRASGGLLYHLRAIRAGAAWGEFREAIAAWLEEWTKDEKQELILIGPSGGYTLTNAWLNQFNAIFAYDFDPLAPLFFRLRHPAAKVRFQLRNLFWVNGVLSIQAIEKVLSAHPRAKVLFSNVLGQVLLEGKASEEQWAKFLTQLQELLKGREWASYHDVFTHENGHIIDHLMEGRWQESLPHRRFHWQLTSKSRHVIEGVFSHEN